MRRFIASGAVVTALALALTGCGGTAEPADTTTPEDTTPETSQPAEETTSEAPADAGELTVWVDANRIPVLKKVAENFKSDTGVTVKLVTKDFEKIRDEFITQAPTGKGPDIIIGAHDWTGKLVQNGVVAPVELGDLAADMQDVTVKALTYEGKVYGVPYSVENIAMFRNTELAPEAPKDFQGMVATGQKLVKDGKAKFPILIQSDPKNGDPYHMYPVQASFGAPVFELTDDGYDTSKVAMGNEGGEKFAAYLAELGKAKVLDVNLSGDIAKEQFTKGKSAYWVTGPWNLTAVKDAGIKYSIEAIPSAGGEPATPFVGVQGFFVSAKSKNPLAAAKFLTDYIGSEAVQTELYKVGGRAPANKAAFEAAKSDADVAAFGKVGVDGVPMPNVPAMDAVWTDWGGTEAALIKGDAKDTAKAWKDMAASIEKKIAEMK